MTVAELLANLRERLTAVPPMLEDEVWAFLEALRQRDLVQLSQA